MALAVVSPPALRASPKRATVAEGDGWGSDGPHQVGPEACCTYSTCNPSPGISSQVRPSNVRPAAFLLTPPFAASA